MHPSQSQIGEYEGHPDEKKAIEEFEKKRKQSRDNPETHNFRSIEDFYNKSPFLSSANDLLKALKEGLISELVLISSYRKSKNQDEAVYKRVLSGVSAINKSAEETVKEKVAKIKKTFGQFPNIKIEMTGVIRPDQGDTKSPVFKPYRWEVLRDKFPDFDIFIDDNPNIIKECVENLPKDKIYAINDYACNRKKALAAVKRVFFFTTFVCTTIKDSDFIYEKPKQNQTQPEPKWYHWKSTAGKFLWIGIPLLLLLSGILGIIFYFWKKKKN